MSGKPLTLGIASVQYWHTKFRKLPVTIWISWYPGNNDNLGSLFIIIITIIIIIIIIISVFIKLVISSVGTIAKESKSLIDKLEKIGLNDNEISAIVRKLINITIRSTYFIFYKRDSEWPSPDPLTF